MPIFAINWFLVATISPLVKTSASPLMITIIPIVVINELTLSLVTIRPFKLPITIPDIIVTRNAAAMPQALAPHLLSKVQHNICDHMNVEAALKSNSPQIMAIVIVQATTPYTEISKNRFLIFETARKFGFIILITIANKRKMIKNGYQVSAVGKELESINDVEGDIDVIDLCINPAKGLKLIKECKKDFKTVVIQPGAESPELTGYLKENDIEYLEGCLLVGLKLYK
ncbi:MAG: hypothetical protein BWY74_04539 [Firmicutes bacterium ADurb.Bin419]|nr:MAG: hypothetical protein BWY74_04539 [Firmicutes bacterium ADurb.Bin419]